MVSLLINELHKICIMNKIDNLELLYIPDFDLNSSDEEIDEFQKELSSEEKESLKEILTLEQQANVSKSFMSDLLDAVKKGALDYVDSMTDTTDSISSAKRSDSVRQWDDTEIEPINKSANKAEADAFAPRTMADANKSALRHTNEDVTKGMSESGKQLFQKYETAYNQRTKSLSQLSKDGSSIKRSETNTNLETLSGLRGYRIGPVVSMPTASQAKEQYSQYVKDCNGSAKTPSAWLYDQNMKQFDTELAKQLGFKSANQAREWRAANKLTVHEGPDGMFMVPSDVHAAARHDGYRSMMSKYMKGEISKEEMDSYVRAEKVAYAKHEVKERGTRMIKGIGLSVVKDILKCSIVVLVKETINEFKQKTEEKFVVRMMRVFKQCWEHVKNKFMEIVRDLLKNIKASIVNEFLTALNDFLFKTFKNIFKVIRQMWSSLKSAFKIICSDTYSVAEKVFEVAKVLSAGFVGVIGFSLSELIEKLLTSMCIPFASFISECLSGLFSGIMSAVVLMLFDNVKQYFISKDNEVSLMQLRSRRLCIEISQVSLDSLKFYKRLDEHIGVIFSSVTAESLNGSIKVCEDLGVPSAVICKTTKDVDAFMASRRR